MLLWVGLGVAQVLPDTLDASTWELQLEDQAEQAPDGLDWTQLSDVYNELARRPIDLNRASVQELLRVPGITPQLVRNLRSHQGKYGPLLSIYELQAVPGFTESVIRQIIPFVRVAPATPYDLGPGPPQPPSLARIGELSRFTFIQRVQRNLSYRGDGTTWTPDTLRNAQGNPYRLYTRLWLQANPYFSLALIGEKDYYEPLRWDPQKRYYGYDFLSGHVAIGGLGRLQKLIVGDYILQVGQGLVLARGLGFGKGGDVILTLKQPAFGLVPYTSVNEYQFWRGAAVSYRLANRWEVIGFVSRLRQDGTTISDTTDEEEVVFVRTLLSSGLHRTPSELNRRQNLLHTAQGAVLTYRHRYTTLGGTFLEQRFEPSLRLTGPAFYKAGPLAEAHCRGLHPPSRTGAGLSSGFRLWKRGRCHPHAQTACFWLGALYLRERISVLAGGRRQLSLSQPLGGDWLCFAPSSGWHHYFRHHRRRRGGLRTHAPEFGLAPYTQRTQSPAKPSPHGTGRCLDLPTSLYHAGRDILRAAV